MNNYEDWAQLVARKLKGEADIIAAIDKDELDDAAATEAFVSAVLTPFLPENFGVGSGRIVDAFGNRSDHLDVIVYNRNFPRIGLRGTQSDYLYESVLAAFSIRAKYVRKSFFESMDACASLARLEANIDKTVLIKLAKRNGLKPGPNKSFVHADPLRTARFELIGRPPAFMFGFTGIKGSLRQLQENIELWIQQRQLENNGTPMRAFPAVIATQGCFAWRNAAPLALSNREMLGLGIDDAPIRLIILQLLHMLNRRLNSSSDGYGLKPNLTTYLSQFKPPVFEAGVGLVDDLVSLRVTDEEGQAIPAQQAPTLARDRSKKATVTEQPVEEIATAAADPEPVEMDPTPSEAPGGVFDKPSPFASAPKPDADTAQAVEPQAATAARPPAPALGSAPIPMQAEEAQPAAEAAPEPSVAAPPATTPLGSAPIPMQAEEPEFEAPEFIEPEFEEPQIEEPRAEEPQVEEPRAEAAPEPATPEPAALATPPKPPVDINLTGETEIPEDLVAAEESDYDQTVVIAPDASLSRKKEPAGNDSTPKNPSTSTDSFIERVKEQLANPEQIPEDSEDSFSSTIQQP